MTLKKKIKDYWDTVLIVILLIIIMIGFSYLNVVNITPKSGMTLYTVKIRYFEYRTIENISSSTDLVLEGSAFTVRFDLNSSKEYRIYYGYKKGGVIDEIHRIDRVFNTQHEIYWIQFDREGFVGLTEIVMDMCINIEYEIGVIEIVKEN